MTLMVRWSSLPSIPTEGRAVARAEGWHRLVLLRSAILVCGQPHLHSEGTRVVWVDSRLRSVVACSGKRNGVLLEFHVHKCKDSLGGVRIGHHINRDDRSVSLRKMVETGFLLWHVLERHHVAIANEYLHT